MKIKTFFISYILFLSILLAAIITISIYLSNHHMAIIHEQNTVEYDRITSTIERDVNGLYDRNQEHLIEFMLETHREFQQLHGVRLSAFPLDEDVHYNLLLADANYRTIKFVSIDYLDIGRRYEFTISGRLHTSYLNFEIAITFDATDSILELRQIQSVLLYLFMLFSLVAAIILYGILNKIFKPLETVARGAEKIAKGDYSERIQIAGTSELALMVNNFNQMGEEIEKYITQLQEEAERKQQFIDNLAHELRTPLTSIYGYAEYIQRVKLTEEEKLESTMFIMEEAGHMRNITNSMLELAKLRDYEPELEKIQINELFNQLKGSLDLSFQKKNIAFIIEPIKGYINGQNDLIRSLISNLCINAAKACSPNIGKVILKANANAKGIKITVADNGCGIEAAHIAKLTEPFYQVDTVRNKRTDGIGLGLAIVKQIVDIHKAELLFKSKIDVGTEVSVIFTTS